MSRTAFDFMNRAVAKRKKIAVSAITLAEVVYLSEKGRIPVSTMEAMVKALRRPDGALEEIPLDAAIVEHMSSVGRREVPDLPDRIIAATALYFGVPVISRDREIRSSGLTTIW